MKRRLSPRLIAIAFLMLPLTVLGTGTAFAGQNGQKSNNGAKSSNYQTNGTPQSYSKADQNNRGANTTSGANPYKSTGNGQVQGGHQPGSEGKADNKYPPGQAPGGSDHNKGYECDQNPGIGNGNPAHSGCGGTTTVPTKPCPPPPPCKCSTTTTSTTVQESTTTTSTTTPVNTTTTIPGVTTTTSSSINQLSSGTLTARQSETAIPAVTSPGGTIPPANISQSVPQNQEGLAYTGTNALPLAGGALAALLIGGFAVAVSRRKRTGADS